MRAFPEVVDGEMDFRELSMGYGLWVGKRDEAMGSRVLPLSSYETANEKVLAIRIK